MAAQMAHGYHTDDEGGLQEAIPHPRDPDTGRSTHCDVTVAILLSFHPSEHHPFKTMTLLLSGG